MDPYLLQNAVSSILLVMIMATAILVIACMMLLIKNHKKEVINEQTHTELRLMRYIFNLSDEASVLINSEGIVTEANDKAADIYGISRDKLIGSIYQKYAIFLTSKEDMTEILRSFSEGNVYQTYTMIAKGEGEKRFRIRIMQVKIEEHVYYLVHLNNMDHLFKDEKHIHELETRLNEIEKLLNIAYMEYEPDTGRTLWSRNMYELLNQPINTTVPAVNLLTFFDNQTPSPLSRRFLLSLKEQKPFDGLFTLATAEGTKRSIRLRMRHLNPGRGEPNRTICMLRDETRLYSLDREVRYLKNVNRSLMNNTDFIVLGMNQDGTLQSINPYAAKLIGLSPEELRGQVTEKYFGKPTPQDTAYFSQADHFYNLSKITDANGRSHDIVWNLSSVPDKEGSPYQIAIGVDLEIMRDILLWQSKNQENG